MSEDNQLNPANTVHTPTPLITTGATETHQAAGVTASLRIPPFWKADPELWFCQAEAVFATSKITSSKIKFQTVIANLEFDILRQVTDLVKGPPENPYEALRDRLINVFAESENRRIRRLLEERKLDDCERPSHFLNDLRRLAGNSFPSDLLRSIWLRGLPDRMQATLAASAETDFDKIAEIADRIADVYEPTINQVSSDSCGVKQTAQLQEAIQVLTLQIGEVMSRLSRRDNAGNRSRNNSRNRSQDRNKRFCFYHQRFRDKARKCRDPCDWHSDNTKQGN